MMKSTIAEYNNFHLCGIADHPFDEPLLTVTSTNPRGEVFPLYQQKENLSTSLGRKNLLAENLLTSIPFFSGRGRVRAPKTPAEDENIIHPDSSRHGQKDIDDKRRF